MTSDRPARQMIAMPVVGLCKWSVDFSVAAHLHRPPFDRDSKWCVTAHQVSDVFISDFSSLSNAFHSSIIRRMRHARPPHTPAASLTLNRSAVGIFPLDRISDSIHREMRETTENGPRAEKVGVDGDFCRPSKRTQSQKRDGQKMPVKLRPAYFRLPSPVTNGNL